MTCDMDQPCMSCCMMITTTMYLILFHHFMMVLSPVNSMLSHDDRLVMEVSYGVLLQPHVWDNDDVIIMM